MGKIILALICFGAAALAQTRARTDQIQGPQLPDVRLVALVNGRLAMVALGAGIEVVQVGGIWTVRATQPQALVEAKLSRAADGSWPLPQGCALVRLYRNGLRQLAQTDYAVSGGAARFVAESTDPSSSDDVVVAECRQ